MWAITFLIGIWSFFIQKQSRSKTFLLGLVYITFALATVFILLPALWHDPIGEAKVFLSMDLFTWGNRELLIGSILACERTSLVPHPRLYLVTTPLLYIFFFSLGNIFLLHDLFIKREF